jgi:hypothetical protein
MVKGKKKSRQCLYRLRKALAAGRKPSTNGRPPYLEEDEVQELQNEVLGQTLLGNSLQYSQIATLVFFNFYFIFRHGE